MARRKQSNRPRTASGRLSRSKAAQSAAEQETMAVALAQPHRARLPKGLRRSQLAESELGRLLLSNAITAPEFTAGQNYRQLVAAYRRAISAPRGVESALGRLGGGDAFADCRVATEGGEARRRRLDRQYAAARAVLQALPDGQQVASVVGRVVVHDVEADADVAALRTGLSALAKLWKLAAAEPTAAATGTRPARPRVGRATYDADSDSRLFDDDGS
ncbi:hypothetical protein J2X65_003575 [Ancylobacter sp. 3268]|uniref:hypothetical protein n=1 Tax=Ancylobacter sp. 3268 TaxID=2817752 RepID=UPI002855F4B0|nr:hypothetical protein [Ancylobacter sp. 3268]MDR6954207.1 hypothetical protein [Ancylobacter sp. 3268]